MKTAVIYCFSGTGNTLRVANSFKDAMEKKGTSVTVAVIKKGEEVPSEKDFDFVGIAYPVHGFNAPLPIWELVKKFPEENQKAYFTLKTSGEALRLNDSSTYGVDKILKKKGYRLTNEFHYLMPYNIIFRHSDRMAYEMDKTMKERVTIDADLVLNGVDNPPEFKRWTRFVSKLFKIEHKAMPYIGRGFKVAKDKCVGCGACERNCPMKNIKMKDSLPVFGKECVGCMGCSFNCPTAAISIGILNGWKVNGKYSFEKPEFNEDESFVPRYCRNSYRRYFRLAKPQN